MTAPLYFVIAAIVTVFIAAVGIRMLRSKNAKNKQTYDNVCDTIFLTLGSVIIGLGWMILLPIVIFGYVIYRFVSK